MDVRRRGAARLSTAAAAAATLALIALAPSASAFEEVSPKQTPPMAVPLSAALPAVSGTPQVGHTLKCAPGSWTGAAELSFAFQWLRGASPIAGAAQSTYALQPADLGSALSCRVTATSAGGEYSISGLNSGSYTVEFSPGAGNYVDAYFDERSQFSEATVVTVSSPDATSGIDEQLQAGARITGSVSAAGGGPIADLTVCAEPAVSGQDFCASTDADGEYAIEGITPGPYRVAFEAENTQYLREFYEHAKSPAEAKTLTLSSGATITGVDAALATGARISGTVSAFKVGPLDDVEVCAAQIGGGTNPCAETNAEGRYVLEGLQAGEYSISFKSPQAGNFAPQWYSGAPEQSEESIVSVKAAEIRTNVNAVLEVGGRIAGTVTSRSSKAPLQGIEACATDQFEYKCATSGPSGEYAIEGLGDGSFTVEFSSEQDRSLGEPGTYRRQYYNGVEGEEEPNKVPVTQGNTSAGIDAAMIAGGQITGRVSAAAGGTPLAAVYVCASLVGGHGTSACAETDAAGEYTLRGLLSGSYRVDFSTFFESLFDDGEYPNYETQWWDGVPFEAEAHTIVVTAPAAVTGVDAALQSGGSISGRVTAPGGASIAGVHVCAFQVENEGGGCEPTSQAASASSSSASVAIAAPPPAPDSAFRLTKPATYNARTGDVQLTLALSNAGTLHWKLTFKNADVGFADELGLYLTAPAPPAAITAARCSTGLIRRRGRCVHLTVPFSSGSARVASGTVLVRMHAGLKAQRALHSGHTLHVSGTLEFQSSLGGSPVARSIAVVVHPPRKTRRRG